MRRSGLVFAAVLGIIAMPALAQTPAANDSGTGARPGNVIGTGSSLPRSDNASNITAGDTRSDIAPNLPLPGIGANATARDYLASARAALVAGHTGEAQQSLEMAETRALDRSIPRSQLDYRSGSALVARIAEARHALGDGDRAHAVRIIDGALLL
jgi:hypothetical protein